MTERFVQQERTPQPEKTAKELYSDTLKLKREVLSSHQAMGLIRKEVNKRINEMSEDEFKTDPQVIEYQKIGAEYDRQRKLLADLLQKLPEKDKEKLAGLTNLKQVETELASPDKEKASAETSEGMSEAEIDKMIEYAKNTARPFIEQSYWEAKKAELKKKQETEAPEGDTTEAEIDKMLTYARDTGRILELSYWEEKKKEFQKKETKNRRLHQRQKIEESNRRIEELEDILTEKYRILRREVGVIDRRPLGEEIKKLEDERNQLTKDLKPSGKTTQSEHKVAEKPVKVAPEEPIQKPLKQSPEIVEPEETTEAESFIPKVKVEESEKQPEPKIIDRPVRKESAEHTQEVPIRPTSEPIQEESVLREKEATRAQGTEKTEEIKIQEVTPEERAKAEILLAASEQEEGAITVEQKNEIDRIISEHPENPAEFVSDSIVKKENTEKAAELNTDNAVNEAVAVLEDKKVASREKTILAKIRESVKTKAAIYVGAGLLTLMSFRGEAREYLTEMPGNVVKVLDKAPDIKASLDLPKMIASEAARYNVKPYLVARFIGSNDYFGLEAIKMADTLGLEGTARSMYESSLADYMENFAETRKANRFTTLDKHTARGHIDAFVQIYTGQEQADSGVETYGKLKKFLQDKFGAAKAYELALKVSSEKDIHPALLEASRKDAKEQSAIMSQAMGKSNIYFNQEEGIFNVVYKDKLIDTYTSRAGFMNVPESGYVRGTLGYGRTPDGQFAISSIERGYSTLRWKDSFLPYGAEIRLGETGEVEYKYRNRWYPATGSEATYFDQGRKIQPNKSEKDMKFLKERSKGETSLSKVDFATPGGLMTRWEINPFGPIAYRLSGRPELIHSNPNDADNILHPSHGCIRLDKEDVRVLEPYIGAGVSKMRISSESGGSWRS